MSDIERPACSIVGGRFTAYEAFNQKIGDCFVVSDGTSPARNVAYGTTAAEAQAIAAALNAAERPAVDVGAFEAALDALLSTQSMYETTSDPKALDVQYTKERAEVVSIVAAAIAEIADLRQKSEALIEARDREKQRADEAAPDLSGERPSDEAYLIACEARAALAPPSQRESRPIILAEGIELHSSGEIRVRPGE